MKTSKRDADMQRVIEKLDKLDERLDSVDKTLIKQESNLSEHMRRTKLLEEKMEPVESHVRSIHSVMKFLMKALVIFGILAGVAKLFVG